MMKRTHLAGGALLTTAIVMYTPISIIPSLFGLIGSTLPDWDYRLGFKHRGISHSLLSPLILGLFAYFLNSSFGFIFICNYILHIAMDSLTKMGVPIFAPFNWRYVGLKLFRTGSGEDFFIGLLFLYFLFEIFTKL